MTTISDSLNAEARARLEQIMSRHWSEPGDHPLSNLDGAELGDYRLLALLGPKNNVGSRYYQCFLVDRGGNLSREPLALGLQNSGPYPAFNWIELTRYDPAVRFDGLSVDITEEGQDEPFFILLSQFVPPGGHMMVEYDSPGQKKTERVLTLRYPPVTSPVGYLLFCCGARSYRDWYISEGGREGPRKLQAFRPLNEEIAREKEARLREEVTAILSAPDNPQHGEWGALARELGRKVLEELGEG